MGPRRAPRGRDDRDMARRAVAGRRTVTAVPSGAMLGSRSVVHETKGLFPVVHGRGRLDPTVVHPADVGDAAAEGRRQGETTVGDKREILVIWRGGSGIHLAPSASGGRR